MRKKEKQRNPRRSAIILSIMAFLSLAGTMSLLGCTYSSVTYFACGVHSSEDPGDSANSDDHEMLNCGNYACHAGHGLGACGEHCICTGDHSKMACGHYGCEIGYFIDHTTQLDCGHYACTATGDHSQLACGH